MFFFLIGSASAYQSDKVRKVVISTNADIPTNNDSLSSIESSSRTRQSTSLIKKIALTIGTECPGLRLYWTEDVSSELAFSYRNNNGDTDYYHIETSLFFPLSKGTDITVISGIKVAYSKSTLGATATSLLLGVEKKLYSQIIIGLYLEPLYYQKDTADNYRFEANSRYCARLTWIL